MITAASPPTSSPLPGCFVCLLQPRGRGLLCTACAQALAPPGGLDEMCPEQINPPASAPADDGAQAWLIDGWGLPHSLRVPAQARDALRQLAVGRDRRSALCIAEPTVSLHHARLEHRPLSNAWFVADDGSNNGTFVNDERVPRRFPLEPGDRLFVGRRVGFYFVPLDDERRQQAARDWEALRAGSDWDGDTVGDAGDVPLLRIAAVKEGGAVATWAGERAVLSELELDLVTVLHQRHAGDSDVDPSARGFVPAAHLLEVLGFSSEAPTHANLRGLVRQLRRKFADSAHPVDVIESRQGLGYRLARPIELV